MSTTNAPRITKVGQMIADMINSGELSVREAQAELDSGWLRGDDFAIQLLAHFVLDHFDDPDFRASRAYCHRCGAPVAGRSDEGAPCVECGAPASEVRD